MSGPAPPCLAWGRTPVTAVQLPVGVRERGLSILAALRSPHTCAQRSLDEAHSERAARVNVRPVPDVFHP